MSKSYYLQCKSLHSLPKFASKLQRMQVGNKQFVSVLFIIPIGDRYTWVLKNIQPPKPNISKEEAKAIQELKKDQERIILATNKGVSMVVMDKEDYIKKSEDLLKQTTYRELGADPTNK